MTFTLKITSAPINLSADSIVVSPNEEPIEISDNSVILENDDLNNENNNNEDTDENEIDLQEEEEETTPEDEEIEEGEVTIPEEEEIEEEETTTPEEEEEEEIEEETTPEEEEAEEEENKFPLDLIIDSVDIRGNGCPQNSIKAMGEFDQNHLFWLFDEYKALAGGTSNRRMTRKTCNITIGIQVPQNYSIGFYSKVIWGRSEIPKNGTGKVTIKQFLVGQTEGLKKVKTFTNEKMENFHLKIEPDQDNISWTGCGKSTNLRINTNILVKTNSLKEPATISVGGLFAYHLKFKRCD